MGLAQELMARTKWIFPLCSQEEPAHWVLTWVDFARQKICVFDSVPGLAYIFWAEPVSVVHHPMIEVTRKSTQLALKIVDRIRILLKQPLIDWSSGEWGKEIHSPPVLQTQVDGWSCGLFILMALRVISDGETTFETAGDQHKDQMRREAVEHTVRDTLS